MPLKCDSPAKATIRLGRPVFVRNPELRLCGFFCMVAASAGAQLQPAAAMVRLQKAGAASAVCRAAAFQGLVGERWLDRWLPMAGRDHTG